LTQSSLEPQRPISKLPRLGLQCIQELSGNAPPAPRRSHEHSLDFPDTRFQFPNRSATNCFAIGMCDKEDKPMISDVVWTKAVKRDAGISNTQVIIQRPHKANGIS
jgi:hypothetical protein